MTWKASSRPESSDTEIAWAAGIFEGEGCILLSIGKRTQRLLVVQMTDEDVIRRFHAVLGGIGSLFPIKQHRTWQPHWKPAWRWSCGAWSDILLVHELFSPWLGARRSAKFEDLLAHPPRHLRELRKRECKRGHPLSGPDADVYLYEGPNGRQRRCNRCRAELREAS